MPHSEFPTVLTIFGATGDLARRKLIPALWDLFQAGELGELWQVVGVARRKMTNSEWQQYVKDVVKKAGGKTRAITEFSRHFVYAAGLFEDRSVYQELATRLGRQDDTWRVCANKLFYLAIPPHYYKIIFQHLAASGLTEPCSSEEGWTRVVVEKPFGKDLADAQELDGMLGRLFREEQIYRIDHYLGKDTVRNILAFRFSNSFLEPAWNTRSIDHIQVRLFEKEGIEGRGDFYDGLGALRDVGQNHMLQLLALFTMENPGTFDADAIRRERAEALAALEIMDPQDIQRQTRRGQYTGYRQLTGVGARSETETYFRLQTHLTTDRWRGVPLYLESGKCLPASRVEVTVRFRHHQPCLCPPGKHYRNILSYRIQPQEGIATSFWVKKPGQDMVIEEKKFAFDYHQEYAQEQFVDAYRKLLLDAIRGDQTLFVSTAEILASWRFIDPIVQGWQNKLVPLLRYKAGTIPKERRGSKRLQKKQIGFLGLGKMGRNMAARLSELGWEVSAFDVSEEARQAAEKAGVNVAASVKEMIRRLKPPRLLWMMVPYQAVEGALADLQPHLNRGDTVIDGGNSYYKDSIKRARRLAKRGVHFLDAGVSGGPAGARYGACLMVGGEREIYRRYLGLFHDLSVAGGFDYMGPAGAGHFVKMVHNGIEYGMMQALAEGFAILREKKDMDVDLTAVANLYNHGSVIESRLVEWLKQAYVKYGPSLDKVSGSVEHSGEGQWTVAAAQELGIPAPIIAEALRFRIRSHKKPSYTGQILSALRGQFGGHDVKRKN